MRTFVISDIHGNNEVFRKSLKQVALKKSDKLILLGDLIDRGNDSKGVLDTVLLLQENGLDVECLMGNHEKMLLEALANSSNLTQWLLNGGDKTLSSFLTSSIEKIPSKYIEFIKTFKYHKEYNGFILVHAALNMKIENPYSDLQTLLWERDPFKFFDKDWLANRKLIHGHNPQSRDSIINSIEKGDNILCIDNGAYLKKENYGTVCVLQLETLQTNFIK
jgi:serine/threonine protein phosphatase 1